MLGIATGQAELDGFLFGDRAADSFSFCDGSFCFSAFSEVLRKAGERENTVVLNIK